MRGDGEREPDVHPGAVALDRRVEKPLDLGERDDFVEPRRHFSLRHAEQRAVEMHVLAAGQVRMESGADLEQRCDAAADPRLAGGWFGDSAEDLEQRALAGAIAAD